MVAGCLALFSAGLVPAAVFTAQVIGQNAPPELASAVGEAWSGRLMGVWLESLLTALAGAAAATTVGFALAEALDHRPAREHVLWIVLQLLVLLPSPYVILQGGINFWTSLGLAGGGLTPFSRSGLIAFQALTSAPLVMVIFVVGRRAEDRKIAEFDAMYRLKGWTRLKTVLRERYGWPAAVSFALVFLLLYWQYDAASILRQNLLALEVYAAFGAFFDHLQAAAVAFPAVLVGVPVSLMLARLLAERGFAPRQAEPSLTRVRLSALLPLIAVPALTLGVALVGLVGRISDPAEFLRALEPAGRDVETTLVVGITGALALTLLAVAAVFCFRMSLPRARWLIVLPCLALAMPAVVTGIGLSLFRGWLPVGIRSDGVAPLVAVSIFTQLPLMILVTLGATAGWTQAHHETATSLRVPFHMVVLRLAAPDLLRALPLLFLIGFALSVREVPASLLNYAADTSTLALTIETMLHFEQPNALSALCLLQFTLVGGVAFGVLVLWAGVRRFLPWVSSVN